MGTEEFWIPAVLAAVGTGASAYNSISANQRSQAQEAQGIQQQQALRQQAAGMVNKTVQSIAASDPAALQRQATGAFVNQLRTNAGATNPLNSGTAGAPGANPRFAADTAASNATVQNFGNNQATDLATMSAAVRQRQQEGLAAGTLQTNLGLTGAQAGSDAFLTQLRAATAGQQNPWIGLGAGLLSGGASAYSKNPSMFQSSTTPIADYVKSQGWANQTPVDNTPVGS